MILGDISTRCAGALIMLMSINFNLVLADHVPQDANVVATMQRVNQLQSMGNESAAEKLLDEGFPDHDYLAPMFSARAQFFLTDGKILEAISFYTAAIALVPEDSELYFSRGQAYHQLGMIDDAVDDLDRAIGINSDHIEARYTRASIYASKHQYKAALADYEYCNKKNPTEASPFFNMAMTYEAMGERKTAIVLLRRFVMLTDNQDWKDSAEVQLENWKR